MLLTKEIKKVNKYSSAILVHVHIMPLPYCEALVVCKYL